MADVPDNEPQDGSQVDKENETEYVGEEIDLEDGELSDEGAVEEPEQSPTAIDDATASDTGPAAVSVSNTDTAQEVPSVDNIPDSNDKPNPSEDDVSKDTVSISSKRKISESSDDNTKLSKISKSESTKDVDESSDSSSSSEDEKSERKRKKKEEKRKRKEKKREKRKREKQREKEERKKRRKMHHDYNNDYDDYYDGASRSPRHGGGYGGGEGRGGYYGDAPGPYDSPPHDDSSEDEFSEALFNMVQSEFMDPNVSMAEKEAMIKRQKRFPGLTQAKLNKMLKKKYWKEFQSQQHHSRRSSSKRHRDEEPKQKCKFYAEGKCQKGERCQYSHNFIPPKKMEACKFFLQGYCAKGDMCIYLHSEVPCKYFHTGQKCFNAEKCKFSHDPLTDSTKPLLEKAILLEETGSFKPEKPSLLGSPPGDAITRYENKYKAAVAAAALAASTASETALTAASNTSTTVTTSVTTRMSESDSEAAKPIPSIFDLNLKPSAELQEKLDSGLYEELTAPLTDDDNDDDYEFGSPVKAPQKFYSDTLSTPTRPSGSIYSSTDSNKKSSPTHTRKNRWGPDLPSSNKTDGHSGDGDSNSQDSGKRQPLLPLPNLPTPFSQQSNNTSQSTATSTVPVTEMDKAQQAAANLSKILSALRSSNVVTTNTKSSDPRVSSNSDPRTRTSTTSTSSADPRQQQESSNRTAFIDPRVSDPRSKVPLLPDPRGSPRDTLSSAQPLAPFDPRSSALRQTNSPSSSPRHQAEVLVNSLASRAAPEINGKPQRAMEYKLKPCDIDNKRVYIPSGAETSSELLKDPRIRKRLQSLKLEESSLPPSLPDITADLRRFMSQNSNESTNATVPTAKIELTRLSARTSSNDNAVVSDPRRLSSETDRPVNPARNTLSRIQATLSAQNRNNTNNNTSNNGTYNGRDIDDDEDDVDSLTIDVPEDDSKRNGASSVEAAYS